MRIFAAIIFISLLPISFIISILIYLSTKSNVIFKQKRVGKDKKEFVIYKFKTMEDNKVFPVGKYIRKIGLDEIPQLINIVKNEMAFVGPRPLTNYDIERLKWNMPEYKDRWKVKPGITGIAQLTNVCDAKLSLENDLYYVKNKSFWLDVKIIKKTLLVPILGKFTK